MKRYFVRLSYDGTNYHGWQRQVGQVSVQQTLEDAMSTQWRREIVLVGCGRTDTGVHAENYIAHFDTDIELNSDHLGKLNNFLPEDIAVHDFEEVAADKHARFDAVSRSYRYRITTVKTVFDRDYIFYYGGKEIDFGKLKQVAELLTQYSEFKPFCKSRTDVKTYSCEISYCKWTWNEEKSQLEFNIRSNRFLRGMIRLIVGASLNIASGKMTIQDLIKAMDNQKRLPRPWSVPGNALLLRDIKY